MRNLISYTCLAVLVVSGIVLTQNEPAEVVAQAPVQAANPLAETVSELTEIAADQQERIESLERRQAEFKSCECDSAVRESSLSNDEVIETYGNNMDAINRIWTENESRTMREAVEIWLTQQTVAKGALPVESKQTAPQPEWSWTRPMSGTYEPRLDPASGRTWWKRVETSTYNQSPSGWTCGPNGCYPTQRRRLFQ